MHGLLVKRRLRSFLVGYNELRTDVQDDCRVRRLPIAVSVLIGRLTKYIHMCNKSSFNERVSFNSNN